MFNFLKRMKNEEIPDVLYIESGKKKLAKIDSSNEDQREEPTYRDSSYQGPLKDFKQVHIEKQQLIDAMCFLQSKFHNDFHELNFTPEVRKIINAREISLAHSHISKAIKALERM